MSALVHFTLAPQSRVAIECRLEQLQDEMYELITLLDAVDGDCDLEPSICGGINPDLSDVMDDREGGDVLDEGEPHDWDDEDTGDDEPSLGWSRSGGGNSVPLGWHYSHCSGDCD